MRSSDTIHLRIAQVLRISFFSALSLIFIAVLLTFFGIAVALYVAAAGIGLVILGPMFGVVAAGVIALKIKNLAIFYAALFILAIFVTAFVMGL